MIISFNPSIFHSRDDEIQNTLAKVLLLLIENDIHFLDTRSINTIFYNENGKYIFNSNPVSDYLSPKHQRSLEELLKQKSRKNITNLHRKHLMHIVVGGDENNKEIHPKSVFKIITERSKIIVENGINDWNFIRGICQKYSSSKTKRRSIYELLDRAIKNETIESMNCGGLGEMIKVTQQCIEQERYRGIFKYKLMAVLDSDRNGSGELPKGTNKSTIEHLKGRKVYSTNDCTYEPSDLIAWHILYKKKIENYMPPNVLLTNIASMTQEQKDDLNSKTYEELDFTEYSYRNIGISERQIKDQFPRMFLSSFSYHDFEQRCEHHKVFLSEAEELVSEIEQILLKMAKIL
jgi:hypothetical protein